MAKKKTEGNVTEIRPGVMDAVYESVPDKEKFEALHEEWLQYQGKVIHPATGQEVSKAELRNEELIDLVSKETDEMKKKLSKKDSLNVEKMKKLIFELGKKAYMEEHGIKNEKDVKTENVESFIAGIAANVTGGPITYERAIATIMSARNPIYGNTQADRSGVLDSLIQTYATLTHKSDHDETKGQSARRLRHLESRLQDQYHKDEWVKGHGNILKDQGFDATFHKSATSGDIMGTVADLLGTGDTDLKADYIKAKLPSKRKQAEYKAT
jgi:hypothetical protein